MSNDLTMQNEGPAAYSLKEFIAPTFAAMGAFVSYTNELQSKDPEAFSKQLSAFEKVQEKLQTAMSMFEPISTATAENTKRLHEAFRRHSLPAERVVGFSELAITQTREALTVVFEGMLEVVPEGTPQRGIIENALETIGARTPVRRELPSPTTVPGNGFGTQS